jgi:RNA polymerase subunit RPABC4/transcription elongation factor Spt4
MSEFSFKYCRVCGGDIDLDAQTCPLCSSRQQVEKNFFSIGFIIFLAIVSFIAIIFLGIVSARAIPHFISFQTNTRNAIAMNSVRVTQSRLEEYYSRKGCYPDTLDHIFSFRTTA